MHNTEAYSPTIIPKARGERGQENNCVVDEERGGMEKK
jgi:hypothetical protein